MDIQCQRCQALVSPDNLNIHNMLAKCQGCGAIFTFDASKPPAAASTRAPGLVPIPENWKLKRTETTLTLTRRWLSPLAFFLAFFCIAWSSFLVVWYSVLSSEGFHGPTFLFFLPLGHIAVGLGMIYFTLALFLNTTTIHADHGKLSIKHAPIPWRGSGDIPLNELDQLYCKEHRRHGKRGVVTYTYSLYALLKTGRERKLVANMNQAGDVHALEHELERFLGIKDQPVVGEYK